MKKKLSLEEKSKIAEYAYVQIISVISHFESLEECKIDCHWNECITVDGTHFCLKDGVIRTNESE